MNLLDLPEELVVECLVGVAFSNLKTRHTNEDDEAANDSPLLPQLFRLSRLSSDFHKILVPRAIYQAVLRLNIPLMLVAQGFHRVSAKSLQPFTRLQLFPKAFDETRQIIEFRPWSSSSNEGMPKPPSWMALPPPPLPPPAPLEERSPANRLVFPPTTDLDSLHIWFGDWHSSKTPLSQDMQGKLGFRAIGTFHGGFNYGLDRILVLPDDDAIVIARPGQPGRSGDGAKRFFGDVDVLGSFEEMDSMDEARQIAVNSVKVPLSFLTRGYSGATGRGKASGGRKGLLLDSERVEFESKAKTAKVSGSQVWDWADEKVLESVDRILSLPADENTCLHITQLPELSLKCTARSLLLYLLNNQNLLVQAQHVPRPPNIRHASRTSSSNSADKTTNTVPLPDLPLTQAIYKYSRAKRFLSTKIHDDEQAKLISLLSRLGHPTTGEEPERSSLLDTAAGIARMIIESEAEAKVQLSGGQQGMETGGWIATLAQKLRFS